MAAVRTGMLPAVLPAEALITVAGAVHTASAVVAVFGADEFRAVEAGPRFIAHTVSIITATAAQAVVQAPTLRAVITEETIRTDANVAHAVAVYSTVHGADLECTVFAGEAFEALTFSVHAAAAVLAATRTLRLGAVESCPTPLTYAATGFSTVVSMTIAVRFHSQFTLENKNINNLIN